jgi:hypothetical protein
MTAISQKLSFNSLFTKVSAAPIAVYRITFGLLMLFSTIRFIANGWVQSIYINPSFHFSYYGFDWIPYPSSGIIWLLFGLMIVGSISILLGFFYRIGTILFFLAFTYVELLEKANYLNHYYFVSLIALLLIFIPANRYFSLDARFNICQERSECSLWEIRILQFQIAIVYFFAGIAKLEADWLFQAQPLKYWLHTANHWPIIGQILKQDWMAYFFSWFGLIYDLTIVFFLLNQKTRKFAYLTVILFHITTWTLFPIGVFPWVMMGATLIFFSGDFHRKILNFLKKWLKYEPKSDIINTSQPTTTFKLLFVSFIAFQIVFPLRYLFYPGNIMWTESGFRFSWRVMLMEKTGYATFYVIDSSTNAKIEIDNEQFLTKNQEKMMATQPDMILQYAHHLGDIYKDTTILKFNTETKIKSPKVQAEVYVTLNSRPNQLFVNPEIDLMKINNDLKSRNWLEPFEK